MTSLTRRVLLVDDSALVRLALSRRLVSLGFEVLHAEDAAGAQLVDLAAVTAVVLDLELGKVDGAELAALLLEAHAGARLAFFTSGASATTLERARGFGPVFHKPDELEELIVWIATR